FVTILPRHHNPNGSSVLFGERLPIYSSGNKGQLIHSLVKPQTFRVRPGIASIELARRFGWAQEGLKADKLRLRFGLNFFEKFAQRKSGPWNNHRPCFHAPQAINALFERK